MALDPRRFDQIEKVVRDNGRALNDTQSTILARLSSHTHTTMPSGLIVTGSETVNGTLAVTGATTLANVTTTGTIVKDTSWSVVPVAGTWVGTGANYRMMPDGTVLFAGIVTKPTNPANGDTWMTGLPAAYRPTQATVFLTPCATRTYNGTQKVQINTNGTAQVFDVAAATGDIILSSIRYPVI
ncbi:MAG TPA: hypothetical protein VFW64_02520 [Pseudonocardiaceae bacterium]|nr:hypothetical protein [Pseudonocardiaceae bacterium]